MKNSLTTPEGRNLASKNFQSMLAKDDRYELMDGEYVLKPEELINICESNVKFFQGDNSKTFEEHQRYNMIVISLKTYIRAKARIIIRDHGRS